MSEQIEEVVQENTELQQQIVENKNEEQIPEKEKNEDPIENKEEKEPIVQKEAETDHVEKEVKDNQEPLVQKETEAEANNLQNLFLKADYNFPIEIKVQDPIEKSGGMSKYVVYTVKGKDCFGEFEIQRRFNEFYTIREILLAKWPGQYVPPIPEKSVSTGSDIVLERTRLLNIFCMKMMQIKHLYYSEEFYDVFLRSTNPDITKQLSTIPKQNITAYLERYKETFNITEIKEISPDMITKMGGVQTFLRKSQTILGKLLEQAKVLSGSRKVLREQFFTIFGISMQEYEKLILQECAPGSLIFTNAKASEIQELAKTIRDPTNNPLDKIQDLLSTEQRDIDAFLQAFSTRESIMASKLKVEQKLSEEQQDLYKIMQGKSTMKGAFSKLSLDEQKQKLELQLNETQKEVDQFKKFFQLVTDVLTTYSIDKFKKDKHETYKSILRDLSSCEQQNLEVYQQFWQKVTAIASEE